MLNKEKYHFEDFTEESYLKYLRLAKEKYVFRSYTDFNKNENFILWRHDVDFSMHRAKRLAEIENSENIKSTYFIHLHSEFYNVFESEISGLMHQIIKLGHYIGLHFDTHYYSINNESGLEEKMEFEKGILEKAFDIKINVFSFHNNTPFTLSCKKWSYAGLINTYAEYFQTEVKYCSDSNGYWKFDRLEDLLLANNKNLHVLTHPEWWQQTTMSPFDKIKRCVNERGNKNLNYYTHLLKINNRDIIDW